MSQWHREHPEMIGTDADPWTIHESYRTALGPYLSDDTLEGDEPDDEPTQTEEARS